MNFSTQIGVRTATTAVLACSAASLLAVALVTHPPHETPTAIEATAPIAIPCRRRVRDSARSIDGTCMVPRSWHPEETARNAPTNAPSYHGYLGKYDLLAR